MDFYAATEKDISSIAFLENAMEGADAASAATLLARLRMFPEGFLVAREEGRIIGYIESCLWNKDIPEFQAHPGFFAEQHRTDARTLYIIFIGVRQEFRRKGVGTQLIDALLEEVHPFHPQRVHAVSRDPLLPFYESMGFTPQAALPGFLHQENYTLMEMGLSG